ncbi:[Pyruvate dehydrogenase [acetyl-transferring]]-phosphatase 1, mitochondrial [Coemansia asiatica]|uniref:[Pyruvate dehydrogenase [acetyl-transferring]]-phosphatase 1, mitochondrial n=1 Tax=Coemansia asiatica TaxID=1052880 RepID=A0A9W7XKE5_9FUNG|nr:[Pyruvate dehydrogenase [acetyl-transferring]]-phosphatase 1, mitochondrial [Coemansia asiatica]
MAESIRQRRAFNNSSSEQEPQQKQQQQSQSQSQQQQSSDKQSGGKATGTKRSLTIAIGGVLTLIGVASYTFMRSPTPVDQVSAVTATSAATIAATATPAQITTALQSVATKRSDAQKQLEGLSRKEKREKAWQLKQLTDLEVTAILRANEKTWDAIDGALRVDTNQVSSNDPIEDYLASGDLSAGGGAKYMVGVFDGHAGYMCAEQLAKRMGPMIDNALESISRGGGGKSASAALNNAVVRLTRNTENQWDPLPMALTASFMAMDKELVHDALAEFKRLRDSSKINELLGPAVAGSCGLVAVVDKDAGEVVVANTGDSRALLGVRLDNGKWKAVRLSEDHTADNKMELQRLSRDHPGETVIRHRRVLGGLIPTRAFGDCRYKWPLDVQQALFPTLLAQGHKYATTPQDYTTPPYVTAHPVIVRHKLSRNDKFIVVASDGLYDQMSDADIVDTVAQWYEALDPKSGLATQDKNAATHLIRTALSTDRMGRRNNNLIHQLLAIPPPVSRRFRDDISVSIVTLNEKQNEKA